MAKYFYAPFGVSGTRTTIPDGAQPDGSVSYTTGFGPDYQAPLNSDPDAKDVPRDSFNELMYQTQLAIQQYQQFGCPDFITTSDNMGTPFSYSIGAFVRYDDGGGFKVYQSLVGSNTALPTDATKWSVVNPGSNDPQTSEGVWATDTGTANTYAAAPSPAYAALGAGSYVRVIIAHDNTAASTLNINGLGAVNILLKTGLSLSGGELKTGMVAEFFHNGTAWVLMNPYTYVEYGSNSNGRWRKYPDGTIEQWGKIDLAAAAVSAITGTITYPIAFPTSVDCLQLTQHGIPDVSFEHSSCMTQVKPLGLTNQVVVLDTGSGDLFTSQTSVSWFARGR